MRKQPPKYFAISQDISARIRSGELVPVSHWNKALKGALVSHLVRNPSAGPEDLVDWEHPAGYRLDPDSLVVSDRVRVLRFVADA